MMTAPFFPQLKTRRVGTWLGISAGTWIGESGYITDLALNVSWDGTRWMPVGVAVLAKGALPTGIPSSGIIGNNGALSGVAAFPVTYSGIYLYFPANAIVTGQAAGLYWTAMSSTTAGTIYNNTYTGGEPTVPATLVPFVTTGPGAYVQTTAEVMLRLFTLPAGFMGPNSHIQHTWRASWPNNANFKTYSIKLGASVTFTRATTTSAVGIVMQEIANRGVTTKQIEVTNTNAANSPYNGATTGALPIFTVDTGAGTTVGFYGQLVVGGIATDFVVCESMRTEVRV